MKSVFICILLSIFTFAEVLIVTSKDNTIQSVDSKELSDIYLKKVTKVDNQKVVPVDNIDDYDKFYKKVVKKTPQQIHAYWMKEIFTGKKRPPKKISRDQIAKELQEDQHSISYSTEKIDAKVIYETK